jgi:prephenate dehydratase
MSLTIGHLGPTGTYAEAAAIAYARTVGIDGDYHLQPYANIAQTIKAVAGREVDLAIVPVENSIEGSVAMTLDTIWQLATIQIQQALVLPISHALITVAKDLSQIGTVYSHPQSLGQCQEWLEKFLPQSARIPMNSNTEALQNLDSEPRSAGIASVRAAELYNLPVLAHPINDRPDNQTKFWVISLKRSPGGSHTSVAFSLQENAPGGLMTALGFFANRRLNLSHVESRPSKRSLGDYVFFIDIEADANTPAMRSAVADLTAYAEKIANFGSYELVSINL